MGFFLMGILIVSLLPFSLVNISATWTRNSAQIDQYAYGGSGQSLQFDQQTCQEGGTDFVLQIAPFGCEPSVIRTDLLEEQNVPVFCQIAATQINPLIKVEAIESMSFSGDYPQEVSGVGFHPARSALGIEGTGGSLNSPILENIGYAVIVLRQQRNSSSLQNCESSVGGDICYVEGNLTARIRYDIGNAYGVGKSEFYLPTSTDSDWQDEFNSYGFWNGRGYLKADYVDEDGARISIYADENLQNKIASVNLNKGETSNQIYLPGFYCLAGLKVRLNNLVDPDTHAVLRVNADDVFVNKNGKFVDNLCTVTKIEKQGLVQKVDVRCNTEDREDRSFTLEVRPKVNLDIGGENDYEIGEKLPIPGKNIYLGFIGSKGNSGELDDLYVRLVEFNSDQGGNLSESQLESIAGIDKKFSRKEVKKIERDQTIVGIPLTADKFSLINLSGIDWDVKLMGFGQAQNNWDLESFTEAAGSSGEIGAMKTNYALAVQDYKSIIDNYGKEKDTSNNGNEFGIDAYEKMIELAEKVGQNKDMLEFCLDYKKDFPNSYGKFNGCTESYKFSNSAVNSKVVLINGGAKRISLQGIEEPDFEDYGVSINVLQGGELVGEPKNLGKEQIGYITESGDVSEFIQLEKIIDEENVRVNVALQPAGSGVTTSTTSAVPKTLKLNQPENFGSKYTLVLKKINLKKEAHVSLLPNVENTYSEASFPFKVGIEKRAIQLSPEQALDKIEDLNDTIEEWEDKSEKLGEIVQGLKGACIAMQGFLTLKNFLGNLGGEGIARKEVMRNVGGINDLCQRATKEMGVFPDQDKIYGDLDECHQAQDKLIGDLVKSRAEGQGKVEDIFQDIQDRKDITSTNFLGKRTIDDEKLLEEMLEDSRVIGSLDELISVGENINVGGKNVSTSIIIDALKDKENKNYIGVHDLRDLILEAGYLNSNNVVEQSMAQSKVKSILGDFWTGVEGQVKTNSFSQDITASQLKGIDYTSVGIQGKNFTRIYNNPTTGQEYLILLNNDRVVIGTYKIISGGALEKVTSNNGNDLNPLNLIYEFRNSESYNNPFTASYGESEPKARFYETEPYKGLPAMIPFDTQNGWYVASQQTLGVGTSIKSYDESGRANSFWLCNVGANGREEFPRSGNGDDKCQQMNSFTPGTALSFAGLEASESTKLVECAQDAIKEASQQSDSNSIQINTKCGGKVSLEVGNPAVNLPDVECTDVMSPGDCKLLFNVCDPVLCPSSRCDLGGRYPVRDVIQSGIVGSIALCLPNFIGFGGEVFVPVCLTGIKAGIDGLLSIFKNYRDCLQTSLDTGENVGVCDEIHSIYLCDFFWRQGLPVMDILIPSLLSAAYGENVKGGGEYLGVTNSWDTAKKSIDYFTQYYGANSYKAFKARTTQDVAKDALCGVFMSGVYPAGGDLLDSLTAPDSPAQFHGRFDEIPFTDRTVPPVSQYKVFYHIYAGNDQQATYSVYLKGASESSYYQDTGAGYSRQVASGYIAPGEYASETKDFTAPAGYQQMCIRVNAQEECGFKQVTTSFGIDYLTEQYVADQASQTNIETEAACISGTRSIGALINSPAGAAEELADPAIYNRGIVRVCATDNPGKGTDPYYNTGDSRWKQVGTCGNTNTKCWLDGESVRDVIQDTQLENETLQTTAQSMMERLRAEGGYLDERINIELDELEGKADDEKIIYLTALLDKMLMNGNKARILKLRAAVYAKIALGLRDIVWENLNLERGETTSPPEVPVVNPEPVTWGDLVTEGLGRLNGSQMFVNIEGTWERVKEDSFDYENQQVPIIKGGSTKIYSVKRIGGEIVLTDSVLV